MATSSAAPPATAARCAHCGRGCSSRNFQVGLLSACIELLPGGITLSNPGIILDQTRKRQAHLGLRTVADAGLPGQQRRRAQVEAAQGRGKVQHAKEQCGPVGQREEAPCWARPPPARPSMAVPGNVADCQRGVPTWRPRVRPGAA